MKTALYCPECGDELASLTPDDPNGAGYCPQCDVRIVEIDPDSKSRFKHISLDDIDLTLEIFESAPETPKPQPDFWAEVLAIASGMEDLIERRSGERRDIPQLEMLCALQIMTDELKRKYANHAR